MSAYTVSQLAHNAGVSVHIVRDYLVRGLTYRKLKNQSIPLSTPYAT